MMKKRLFSLLLCAAMLLGLAVPTFAGDSTATVTTVQELKAALENIDVSKIVIDADITISECLSNTKDLKISEGVTVTLTGTDDGGFGKLEMRPGILDVDSISGPVLYNQGKIEGKGALWVYSGCSYENANNGSIDAATEFCVARFKNYLYGPLSVTADYPETTNATPTNIVIVTNTVDGLNAAAELTAVPGTDCSAWVVLSDMYYDAGKVTLTENVTMSSWLMSDIPVEVPTGKTLTLNGDYNSFNDGLTVDGILNNNGDLFINGGTLEIMDSNAAITYRTDTTAEGTARWETANSHVLFNRGTIRVENGSNLKVGGALQNYYNAQIDVFGTMTVSASASGNNAEDGVINGSVKSFGTINVDGGTLNIDAADADHAYSAAFVNLNEINLTNGAVVNANGKFYNYGSIHHDGDKLNVGGVLYNGDEEYRENAYINLNAGEMNVSGYVRNWNEININGGSSLTVQNTADENYTTENRSPAKPESSVLCNNYRININGGGTLTVEAADGQSTNNGLLRNNGEININGGGTLDLKGTMDNNAKVWNYDAFKVYDSTRIYNHGHLYVRDSATFGENNWSEAYGSLGGYGEFNAIDWKTDPAIEKNAILIDDFTYRIWSVQGPEHRQLDEQFYQIKDSEYRGLIVMRGQDYFGGWVDAKSLVGTEIQSFDVVVENFDNDQTEYLQVGPANGSFDTFSLFYKNWGDTQLKIRVEGEEVRTYDAGTALNYIGFYTEQLFDGSGTHIDEQTARNYSAVTGNCYVYNLGDQLWLMKNDDGFGGDDLNIENYEFEIYPDGSEGGKAEIGNQDQNGWYPVSLNDRVYLQFRYDRRGNSDKYDLRFEFVDGQENFDFNGSICGNGFNLRCIKPMVYVESVAVPRGAGLEVTVNVKAGSVFNLGAFDLTLKYDTARLTYQSFTLNRDFQADPAIQAKNGEIRIPATANDSNNGADCGDAILFSLTFTTTAEAENFGDAEISFVGNNNMLCRCNNNADVIAAALFDGAVQTFIPGDVLRDGVVNIRDAVRLLRASAQLCELSAAEYQASLVVANENEPSVNGVLAILKYLANDTPLVYKPVSAFYG